MALIRDRTESKNAGLIDGLKAALGCHADGTSPDISMSGLIGQREIGTYLLDDGVDDEDDALLEVRVKMAFCD